MGIVAEACHEDHRRVRIDVLRGAEDLVSVSIRHPDMRRADGPTRTRAHAVESENDSVVLRQVDEGLDGGSTDEQPFRGSLVLHNPGPWRRVGEKALDVAYTPAKPQSRKKLGDCFRWPVANRWTGQ